MSSGLALQSCPVLGKGAQPLCPFSGVTGGEWPCRGVLSWVRRLPSAEGQLLRSGSA